MHKFNVAQVNIARMKAEPHDPLMAGFVARHGLREFGDGHFIAVSPKGEIFVADSVNGAMQEIRQALRRTA